MGEPFMVAVDHHDGAAEPQAIVSRVEDLGKPRGRRVRRPLLLSHSKIISSIHFHPFPSFFVPQIATCIPIASAMAALASIARSASSALLA